MGLRNRKKKKIILISIISAVLAVSIALAIILPIVLKKKEEPNNTPTKYFGTISVSADNAPALLSGNLTDGTTTVALSDLTITSETDVEQWLSEFELLKSNNKELTLNINIKNTSDKSLCVKVEDKSEGIKNVKKSINLNQTAYEDGTYTIIENKNDSIDFAFDIKITNITNLITYFDYQIKLITDVQTLSEVNAQGIDLNFDTQTKTAEAKAYGTPTGDIILPKCIFYNNDIFEVTKIADYAFSHCSDLTSVVIPDSITFIASGAFDNCTNLTSVTIPNSVTSINNWAFYLCKNLTDITIPNSVKTIGKDAFYGCSTLTSIVIPDGVTSIGSSIFQNCSALTSVTIPNSVMSIGTGVFQNCSALTSITIPDSITSINSSTFSDCTSLTNITIPNSVNSIGDYAFSNCLNLTSVTIPNNVKTIGKFAFYSCTSLASVSIPNNVTSIGSYAFNSCSNFTKVIVNDVNKWAEITFGNQTSNPLYYAKKLYLSSDTENPITNIVLDTATKVCSYSFYNYTSLTSVTIGNSVQTIENDAFSNCLNLTKVIVEDVNKFAEIEFKYFSANPLYYTKKLYLSSDPTNPITNLVLDTATKVGIYAFYNCTGLTCVTIGDSVTSIGSDAFYNCTGLTCVTIDDSVTSIGNSAFSNCTGLTCVTIGNSITSIGNSAFYNCSSLTKVIVEDVNKWAEIEFKNQTSNPLFYAQDLYLSSDTENPITNLVLDTATKVGSYAFYYCTSINSATIADSVKTIGNSAFANCSVLTSINISNKIESIGSSAFPSTVLSEYNNVYYLKSNDGKYSYLINMIDKTATSVEIHPDCILTAISAFSSCTSLTKVIVNDVNKWAEITFGNQTSNPLFYAQNLYLSSDTENPITNLVLDTATKVSSYAFDNCRSLTSVTIGDGVQSIEIYAFSSCTSLTSVTIGDNVQTIGSSAFYNCTSLTSITIGDSVTFIGIEAFSNCSNLTKVIVNDVNKFAEIEFGYPYANPLYYAKKLYLSSDTKNPITNLVLDTATKVSSYAFDNCRSLTSVTIGDGVQTIGIYAFYNCKILTSVTIGDNIQTIGISAFYNCTGLTKVIVNDVNKFAQIKLADYYANPLYYAKKLYLSSDTKNPITNLVLDTATKVGSYAFYNCRSLTSVTIGNSVQTIENDAFYNCSSLTKVIVEDVNKFAQIKFGNYSANPLYYAKNLYLSSDTENPITNLVLDTATKVSSYAFDNCRSLTSVTIGDGVQTIENDAFSSCTSLTKVIVNDVNKWAEITFGNQTSNPLFYAQNLYLSSDTENPITNLVLDTATKVSSYAFDNCKSLTSVTIGDGVQTIGIYAFSSCTSLTKVIVNDVNKFAQIEFGNYYANPLYYAKNLYLSSDTENPITHLVLDTATKVGSYAFQYCTGLTSVTIGDNVQTIGIYAFYNCTILTSVTIGDNIQTIGISAFYNCTGLTKVIVNDVNKFAQIKLADYYANPLYYAKNLYLSSDTETPITYLVLDTATKVGSYAFYRCTGLTNITIPDSVTTIGSSAFYDCTNLRVVNYTGTEEEWKAITIDSGNESLTNITPNFNYVIPEE